MYIKNVTKKFHRVHSFLLRLKNQEKICSCYPYLKKNTNIEIILTFVIITMCEIYGPHIYIYAYIKLYNMYVSILIKIHLSRRKHFMNNLSNIGVR